MSEKRKGKRETNFLPQQGNENKNVMKKLIIIVMALGLTGLLPCGAITHRGLIFGLGRQQDTSWARIHGDNDIHFVRQMLQTMGYTDIVALRNEEATKAAMVDAFRQLAVRCRRGDHVYIHYSGHGQLMTDLDGDEQLKWTSAHSRWDEAWIPYDAYMTYGPDDRGEKHLGDDEVARLLAAIRNRIGTRGQLIVVVDACHSGDATCGPNDTPVRGIDQKFVIPRTGRERQATATTDEQWLTISACRPYQLCQEMGTPEAGKLTYALYQLGAAFFDKSNLRMELLLQQFMDRHPGRLPQTPMVSGKK
mgnify:CR=1 FL=1